MKKGMMTVILPVYNEEKILNGILGKIKSFVKQNPDYEFLIVNDGSTDNTKRIIKDNLDKNTENILFLSYPQNHGKGYAIKRGVDIAKGEHISFLDGDLAYSLNHLKIMRKELLNYDLVIGCRDFIKENEESIKLKRKITGKTFNYLSRKIMGFSFRDTQAGIKGFRNKAAKELFRKQFIRGFAFDVEILYRAIKNNYKIHQIPVRVSQEHKKSGTNVKILNDSVRMFYSLLKIKLVSLLGKYD
jgi:dolichyl-phosphate beta-glucosyltransferase